MSRQIDRDKPLSDEDRRYLLERGSEQEVEYIDSLHAEDRAEEPEELDHGPDFPEFANPSLADAQARNTPEVEADPDADDTDAEDAAEPESDQYDEMNKNALKAEAERRELPTSGTAEELRERLRAADADQA